MGESSRKYENGKIYCIRNWVDDDIYVGSTTQALSKRFAKHRGDSKKEKHQNRMLYTKMNEVGLEHFYIELIEKYECCSKEELQQKEGEWIRKISTLNHHIAGRTRKESAAEYHLKNQEKVSQRKLEQRLQNPDKKKEQNRKNYENNREEINRRRKERIVCNCGVSYQRRQQTQHLNSTQHKTFLQQEIII